jgi:Uncharacterized protein, homolog of phage Mu protein gp30
MDKAHKQTDELLEQMERRLNAIYRRADKEIRAKWDDYMSYVEKRSESLKKAIEKAKTDEELEKAQEAYKRFLRQSTFQNDRYKTMVEQVSKELLNVNQTALAYVNGELPEIYSLNYNFEGEKIAGQLDGYSFTLVDQSTVANLAKSDKTLLPYKVVDGVKDVRWNTKKINAEVMQGILQGESIPKIAKRLQNVENMNKEAAVRNARTMTTSAECKGRQDSFEKAAKDGIVLKREWIATNDGRTRHWHATLDGKLADIDKPFHNEVGYILYPGDPNANPANVYNCRCTISAKVIGFKKR